MASKVEVEGEEQFSSPYRSDGKLYGFVCIVTGATSPLGRAVVHELAAHGAACIYACSSLPSSDAAEYTSLIAEQSKSNPNTKIIPYAQFHAATEEGFLMLIDDVLNVWGRLDVFVLTTDLAGPQSISETGAFQLTQLFEEHCHAPFFAVKYGPAAMAKTMTIKGSYPNATPKTGPYGSIIVVTSVASTHGGVGGPALTMASHAALGVVKSGVDQLRKAGSEVRINAVSACGLADDAAANARAAAGRAGVPQEVARVVGFLASGFSSYVTGSNMIVDGGSSALHPLATS